MAAWKICTEFIFFLLPTNNKQHLHLIQISKSNKHCFRELWCETQTQRGSVPRNGLGQPAFFICTQRMHVATIHREPCQSHWKALVACVHIGWSQAGERPLCDQRCPHPRKQENCIPLSTPLFLLYSGGRRRIEEASQCTGARVNS